MSLQRCPAFAPPNSADVVFANAHFAGQVSGWDAAHPDGFDLCGRKPCSVVLYSRLKQNASLALNHVSRILLSAPGVKMLMVYASPNIASVIYLEPRWDLSMLKFIGNPVRGDGFTGNAKVSISARVFCTDPQMTSIRLFNIRPKVYLRIKNRSVKIVTSVGAIFATTFENCRWGCLEQCVTVQAAKRDRFPGCKMVAIFRTIFLPLLLPLQVHTAGIAKGLVNYQHSGGKL